MKKLVLIDGHRIAFRAFYGLPLLSNASGMYTNAVYGFTMMSLKLLAEERPTHMLVAFDAGKITFRLNPSSYLFVFSPTRIFYVCYNKLRTEEFIWEKLSLLEKLFGNLKRRDLKL
jgi:hypothetical protein